MTQQVSSLHTPGSGGVFKAILLTGLLAGTLDGTAAAVDFYISSGRNPLIVYQYIASAVFGKEAYSGGWGMAFVGLIFHYIIATGWALLFFVLYPPLKLFRVNKIVAGIVYGLIVWTVMNLVILPLTSLPPRSSFEILRVTKSILIIIFMIGIPISILAHKYYSHNNVR